MTRRQLMIGLVVVVACAGGVRGALPKLEVAGVGGMTLPAGEAGATQLSGLSHIDGDAWLAVSDTTGEIFRLTIQLDPVTGAITSAGVTSGLELEDAKDLEGVAYDPSTQTAWVSDESGPAIRRHDLTTGAIVQTLTMPTVFENVRPNLSLESLSRNPTSGDLWTANEEALSVDGPVSSEEAGSVVRLQKFDPSGAPAGQWAYVTEPIRAVSSTVERSGVSDLVALPDGRLLVLERELATALPAFMSRLYLVDFEGATDISTLDGLTDETYTPVTKSLLWSSGFIADNFEGIGLGPKLNDGSYSLLLVSDDGSLPQQRLYALRISGVVPEPSSLLPLIGGLMGYAMRRHRCAHP